MVASKQAAAGKSEVASMALGEDGSTQVDVAGETVTFPRYVHRAGAQMTQEQRELEAAAFDRVDRLRMNRAPGPRAPGDDDDDAPPPDGRTPQQREQDVDFEALAVQAIARREMERRGIT